MSQQHPAERRSSALQECRERLQRLEKRLALVQEDQQRQEHINDNHRALLYKINKEYEELLERNGRLTDELHCKNLYLTGIIEASPTPMFTLDASLRIVSCNPAAMALFGFERAPCSELMQAFPAQMARKMASFSRQALADNRPQTFELSYAGCNAEHKGQAEENAPERSRLLEMTLFPVPHGTGGEGGVCCLVRDLTPVHEEMAERIVQSQLVELGALSAGIAHEVNNPVNGIMNYIQLCLDIADSEEASAKELAPHLGQAQQLAGRVAAVVQSILGMASPDDGQDMEFCIQEAIDDALLLLRYELRRNDITLHLQVEEGAPPMLGRKVEVTQILQNLFLNAIQAHSRNPSAKSKDIWLDCSRDAKQQAFCICVRDNGPGLGEGQISSLFHPFVTTREQGTGLGLYLSLRYARRAGGGISAANISGGGAEFCVRLPLPGRATDR